MGDNLCLRLHLGTKPAQTGAYAFVCEGPLCSVLLKFYSCAPAASFLCLRLRSLMSNGIYLLDYGAGNVRSLANSISKIGYEFEWIKTPEDFEKAEVSITQPP